MWKLETSSGDMLSNVPNTKLGIVHLNLQKRIPKSAETLRIDLSILEYGYREWAWKINSIPIY